MSKQYPGGVISKTAPVPSGPYANSTAPGIWTLEQQAAYAKLGQWPTAGNVDPNAFIENLFSTYLYTGTGAAQTITNGINLSANGGLVWIKNRSVNYNHLLSDTTRGAGKVIFSDSTSAQQTDANDITSFNTTGFSIGNNGRISNPPNLFVSWTFREQPKFFDVVTYTGTGSNTTIAHSLGVVPGSIIVKRTDTTADWAVYHRSLANTQYLVLNTTAAAATGATWWNSTTPTSSVFSLGTDASVNGSGGTYVAYLFAHDAGGFGPTSTDNVISCGSFTTDAGGLATVNLGYEPQWVLFKATNAVGAWYIVDTMRGLVTGPAVSSQAFLYPNTNGVEGVGTGIGVLSTGFNTSWFANQTLVYIAIRRGPMAVPTLGTTVFAPVVISSPSATQTVTTNFPVDMTWSNEKAASSYGTFDIDKLRSNSLTDNRLLQTQNNLAEGVNAWGGISFQSNTSIIDSTWNFIGGGSPSPVIYWNFRRAPSFFDEVCYTGNGSTQNVTHNLGVAPELMIIKSRNTTQSWTTYSLPTGNENYGVLNTTVAWVSGGSFTWNNTTPTNTVFSLGSSGALNGSGDTYVAYLFATCAGVSKVGSYSGNTGVTVVVPCGFTSGVRFVLIKRTDSTGDWYVWDSARGIIAGNDPYLLLNSTAAEVTGTDYVDTYSAGFEVTSTAPAGLNATGGTYIFLAIA